MSTSTGTDTDVKERITIAPPKLWTVVIHNDDFTPIEFVIAVLIKIFHLDFDAAQEITMAIHFEGNAKVGEFTKEIALTKAKAVCTIAQQNLHPLQATAEEC